MDTLPADTLRLHGEKNDSSRAGAALSPNIQARVPALPGFIVRKLFALGDLTERRTVVEACKAELDWARADSARISREQDERGNAIELPRMPHEEAAAKVLNCWGHLYPTEDRAWTCWRRMQDQRAAGLCSDGVADDLRWYLGERRKQRKAFNEAVEAYRRLRAEVDPPAGPACAKEAA